MYFNCCKFKAMDKFEGQSIPNFIKEIPNDDACKAYLTKVKWRGRFRFTKCPHTKGYLKSVYNYECYKCWYVESAKAETLFYKVKIGLHKSFCIALK